VPHGTRFWFGAEGVNRYITMKSFGITGKTQTPRGGKMIYEVPVVQSPNDLL